MYIEKNKRLAIYDFDHTLCFSDGTVKVIDKRTNETTSTLTAVEYTAYMETGTFDSATQEFNFEDFQGLPKNGKPIQWTMDKLKLDLEDSSCQVALVTGRDDLTGPKAWLEQEGIDTDRVFLMCSGDPNKRFCYESLIINLDPSLVELYEDGKTYVMQCIDVCQKYEKPCDAYLITEEIIRNHKSGPMSIYMAR